jgi:hypothetical protein
MTQIAMLTMNVVPKLKFNEGNKSCPWVIPIGLDCHVISPHSNQTQYLDIGVQFGAGFEYQVREHSIEAWTAGSIWQTTR